MTESTLEMLTQRLDRLKRAGIRLAHLLTTALGQ